MHPRVWSELVTTGKCCICGTRGTVRGHKDCTNRHCTWLECHKCRTLFDIGNKRFSRGTGGQK